MHVPARHLRHVTPHRDRARPCGPVIGASGVKGSGPLALEPILVPKPWGGHRLAGLGKPLPDHLLAGTAYGESWEVADLPDHALAASARGRTLVASGPHRGKSLRRLIAESGSELLGSASPTPAGDFPLLFKLLDTAEHLSIQVHPDEEYAGRRRDWFSKTESWYVIDAEPGAAIFMGFRPGVTLEEVRAAAGTPAMAGLLRRVPVKRGDFHHLPAGTVHALGAGVTVAEVQTPSDTTFRLYDWTEEYRRPERPLHLEDALGALVDGHPLVPSPPPLPGMGSRLLVTTPHYWLREHRLGPGDPAALVREPELRILSVAHGRARVRADDGSYLEVRAGGTVVVPAVAAGSTGVTARRITVLLELGLR